MEIVRPTLLLDEKKCRANIRRMADKASKAHVTFRPHFKTHQSHSVGRWFQEMGVTKCTVSSVVMAGYFAKDGWKDITVAFPLNPLEVAEISNLAKDIQLNVCIVSADALQKLTERLNHPLTCLVELDCGYHRTGIDPGNQPAISAILQVIASNSLLSFGGFLTHAGQSYACRSGPEILRVHQQTMEQMRRITARYRKDFPEMVLSVGDTPTCSLATDFADVNEIRPGNFVFYDIMQRNIGSCANDVIAVAMACPVVATYPDRQEVVVHGGGVHFSKDFLRREDGTSNFGDVVRMNGMGWELPPMPMHLKSLSQEHGVIHAPTEEAAKCHPGDILGVLPVHSCMTADVMGEYYTLTGEKILMMSKT